MTRIGPSNGEAALQQAQARQAGSSRHEDELSSRGHRHAAGDGLARHDMRFDQHGAGLDQDERRMQFLESVRRALSSEHAATEEPEPQKRLLAVAGENATTASLFAPASLVAVAEAPPVAPTTAERVDTIVSQIEASVRAERMARGGEGLVLRLDLGEAMPGVASLTIAMSADAIEITLLRNGAEVPPDYALAAQALADRLQSRFAGRVVRVAEADAPNEAEARSGDGLDGISRLLSQRDERA